MEDQRPFDLPGIHDLTDAEFDAARLTNRARREAIALRLGVTLKEVEDSLATMQTSAFDRRVVRTRLADSRDRIGW